MAKEYRVGDKVKTANGWEGKIIAVDSSRGRVAVKATNDGVGHNRGDEQSFFNAEVRKA